MPTSKPLKIGESRTWDVSDVPVTLRRVEPTTHQYGPAASPVITKEQKSRYQIIVDHKIVGFINCATGFERNWYIQAHGSNSPTASHHDMERPINVFPANAGTWEDRQKWDRNSLIQEVPRLVQEGVLVPLKVLKERARALRSKEREEKAQSEQDGVRQRQQNWSERKRKFVERTEQIAVLSSILDRLRSKMSNIETDTLASTIENLRAAHENENSLDYYWYDTEASPDAIPNERAGLNQS